MIITEPTQQDIEFIATHEGFVSRAYRCPAGVLTIGYGFTMGSKIFAAFWRAKHGRGLQPGDTITREEADSVLWQLSVDEYGAVVVDKIKPRKQWHYGGATSMCFNCGPGAANWRWAQALAQGDVARSAELLRTTATTANGRQLPGLVRRRREEARLIESGVYHSGPSPAADASSIRWVQEKLKELGYDPGPIDGRDGPRTQAGVKEFQRNNDLFVDGIAGQATRGTIIRKLDEKNSKQATGGGAAVGGAGGTGAETTVGDITNWEALLTIGSAAAATALVVYAGYWLYRNRGRFTGRRAPT